MGLRMQIRPRQWEIGMAISRSVVSDQKSGISINTDLCSRGFTLIEVLVVLTIVAIITAVAVLAFGQFGRGRREKMIINQFVRVIAVAQQQAILTPEVLGLGISTSGYEFFEYHLSLTSKQGEWQPLRNDVFSNSTAFQSIFNVETKSISLFAAKNIDTIKPAILFSPSGYVTPFILKLKDKKKLFVISVENNGEVEVK